MRSGGIAPPGEARRRGIAEAIPRRSNDARRCETARDRGRYFGDGTLGMDAVVLVGHGGVPRDFPRERLTRLKAVEAARRGRGERPSSEEMEIERAVRTWPRPPESDPYQAGLEQLAERLRPLVAPERLALAYNEFSAPGLDAAGAPPHQ